jgi:hypothetical protein
MTPEDAPNACDEPLAVIKPPEDLIRNRPPTLRALVVPRHWHSVNPARIPLWLFAPQSLPASTRSRARLTSPAPFDPHSSRRRATV